MKKPVYSEDIDARLKATRLEGRSLNAIGKQAKKMKCHPETLSPGYVQRLTDLRDELSALLNDLENHKPTI